jgi:hypothetical protein
MADEQAVHRFDDDTVDQISIVELICLLNIVEETEGNELENE